MPLPRRKPLSLTKQLRPISNKARNILESLQPFPTSTKPIAWMPLKINKLELYLPPYIPDEVNIPVETNGPAVVQWGRRHIISLKQLEDDDVGYFFHFTEDEDTAIIDLFDFLNMGILLSELWKEFKGCDERFAQLAGFLEGARVLRQDPLECLIQFICSSNNNIKRITKMVDFISRKGIFLGCVEGFDFFEFPKLDNLVLVSETELKESGFG